MQLFSVSLSVFPLFVLFDANCIYFAFSLPASMRSVCFSRERLLVYFAWLGLISLSLFFFSSCYLYILLFFFPCLDCFDGITHSIASTQLNASRHGKSSTAVNSIHSPLHPSCLPFLPSFLSPSVLLASGVKCTVKTSSERNCNRHTGSDYGVRTSVNKSFFKFNASEMEPCSPFLWNILDVILQPNHRRLELRRVKWMLERKCVTRSQKPCLPLPANYFF